MLYEQTDLSRCPIQDRQQVPGFAQTDRVDHPCLFGRHFGA
jgi:hypothetical protein